MPGSEVADVRRTASDNSGKAMMDTLSTSSDPTAPRQVAPPYSLSALIRYALGLGTLGFGGPVALVGYMHRDLVEQRCWITEAEYKEGLTLAQIAPGPLAAQLAIYLGYCHYSLVGATAVGVAFVLPSFMMVLALGWLYVRFGGLPWMQAVFYGIGGAVIGIIARSAWQLTRKTVGRDSLRWAIWAALAITTALTETESVPLIIAAGFASWISIRFVSPSRSIIATIYLLTATFVLFRSWGAETSSSLTLAIAPALVGDSTLGRIALYFSEAGAFVFGSGLAIVPFLYGGVVQGFGWLDERQFVDAVAVAMITPGPVVITVGFIGYLVSGIAGACVAALATFLPCYLFTVIPAPYLRRHGASPTVRAVVDGVTAAATGAIVGAVFVLGKRSVTDIPTLLIALATMFAIIRWKAREPTLVLIAAFIGLCLKW